MGPGFAVMIPTPDGAHAVRMCEFPNAEKHIHLVFLKCLGRLHPCSMKGWKKREDLRLDHRQMKYSQDSLKMQCGHQIRSCGPYHKKKENTKNQDR